MRGLTCSTPDRCVVSPAAFLTVTRSHLQYSRPLRGLTCSMPDRCAVSPAVFMTITWSHAAVAAIQERSVALAAAVAAIQARSVAPAAAVAASCGLGSSRCSAATVPGVSGGYSGQGRSSLSASKRWQGLWQRPGDVAEAGTVAVAAICGACCSAQRPASLQRPAAS